MALRAAPLVASLVLAALVAGCAAPAPPPASSGPCGNTPVDRPLHIHGLAVSPERPGELYVATHHGLIRAVNDTGWARVGATQDDLMGFSMHPRNGSTFWASGHRVTGGNMGVRVSRDGGCSWQTLAAKDWDFHAMAVSPADPDHLWGFYRGELRRSTDGGATWSELGRPVPIGALAADPQDAEALFATTQQGLMRSTDGGATWRSLDAKVAFGLAVDPRDASVVYRGGQGFLEKSRDGGLTWSALSAPGGPDALLAYLAVSPVDGKVVYAATAQGAIYKSLDGGATWRQVLTPSPP